MLSLQRRKLVVGNWKMHGNLKSNETLIHQLIEALCATREVEIAICVPYPYLFQAQAMLHQTKIAWGAQNVSGYHEGAFTASISASMIADFACQFAIIGHSERRSVTKENSLSAVNRFLLTLEAGITPIFCVGETLHERKAGKAYAVIESQIAGILNLDDSAFDLAKQRNAVIAYEPVWAIGAKQPASPAEAQEMHAFIRAKVAERDQAFANEMRIIYGGSITSANAGNIFKMPDIDGGLVGRSSLDAEEFAKICAICAEIA